MACRLAFARTQGLTEELERSLVRSMKRCGSAGGGPPGLGDRHADLARQAPDRVRELEPGMTHPEAKHVAAGLAAETVKGLLLRVDLERRGLLFVEGTQPPVLAASLSEGDGLPDDLDQVGARANLAQNILRDMAQGFW